LVRFLVISFLPLFADFLIPFFFFCCCCCVALSSLFFRF
jgi:hypothetical protein